MAKFPKMNNNSIESDIERLQTLNAKVETDTSENSDNAIKSVKKCIATYESDSSYDTCNSDQYWSGKSYKDPDSDEYQLSSCQSNSSDNTSNESAKIKKYTKSKKEDPNKNKYPALLKKGDTTLSIFTDKNYPFKYNNYKCAMEYIKTINLQVILVCLYKGCTHPPCCYYKENYKYENTKLSPRIFCMYHRRTTFRDGPMFCGNKITCNYKGCKVKCAVYNYPGYLYGLLCESHALLLHLTTMQNVVDLKCDTDGCTEHVTSKTTKDLKNYCTKCARSNGVALQDHVFCIAKINKKTGKKCIKGRFFGIARGYPALYCADDAPNGYVDVTRKLCKTCDRRANFAERTSRTVEFCSSCKTKTMSNPSKRCIAIKDDGIQCDVQKHYNYPGIKKPEYCKTDAYPGMIVVTNKNCEISECTNYPAYGFPDSYGTHCEKDKQPGQIDLIKANTCQIKNCKLIHCCVEDNIKKCIEHAKPATIAREKELCQYCNFLVASNYICQTCKNDSIRIEHAIARYLEEHNYDFIHDEQISKYKRLRPDMLFDINGKYVIVEIDENAHDRYTNHQETQRMETIKKLIPAKYVEFIRFNPDYIRYNGKNIIISLKQRLKVLRKFIDDVLKNVALVEDADDYDINVHYLYYPYNDEYDEYNCYQLTRDYKAIKATPRAR